jgi:assimilatory nitrate reductase catalytic subunit
MASSVAGHKRAFGSDTVPGTYEDIELADLVVLVGSNLAWCHPVLYQRLAAAREQHGAKVVVIDPRQTATCEIADIHLAVAPGSDVALFNGLLAHLASVDAFDHAYVSRHANGLDQALAAAAALSMVEIANIPGLDPAQIAAFYRLFVETRRVVTVYSQGVNQSTAGTDKVNAIINCHLATGRIGRPGMGPFSVTGQPNAMGGRETGGLANMLAAHMEIDNAEHRRIVQSFWDSPRLANKPGLKAVDLFGAVGDGRIKALWIMATNPVDSMPQADAVRAAIESCPFVVVSDVTRHTDTTALAHVLLPSAAWGEKNGTVTNSERRISRQRTFLKAPGEARPDWWQLAETGRRMGWRDAFDYSGPAAIFAEYARMTGIENGGTRDLDISACGDISSRIRKSRAVQWRIREYGGDRLALLRRGGFFTPIAARFRCDALSPPGSGNIARISADPQHRPHPRSVAYDDTDGEGRAADEPHRRAVRGGSSGRCCEARTQIGGSRHDHQHAWLGRGPRAHHGAPAAWRRIRSDALDRPACQRCADRRAHSPRRRSRIRPARA